MAPGRDGLGALLERARAVLAALTAAVESAASVKSAASTGQLACGGPGRLADPAVGDGLVAVGTLAVQAGAAALAAADPGQRSDAAFG